MFAVMLTIFILICLVLMVVVLLQSSKGGGLAGAFGGGGGSDSSVLGGRGAATFLSKITVWLAGAFMVFALLLSIMSSRGTEEEVDSVIARRQREGALDVFDVDQGASILEQIQTEGFKPEEGEAGDEFAPAPADSGAGG